MKNEHIVTYNHMEEEEEPVRKDYNRPRESKNIPISLYMLLIVDALLVTAIVFFTFKIIF
ncbi:MAG: hypothetical protein IT242_04150 [Bacteroidia bacterium]|nr:hypothetical protein [Bacteroidia bacterium]